MNKTKATLYSLIAALTALAGPAAIWSDNNEWPTTQGLLVTINAIVLAALVTLKAFQSNPNYDPTKSNEKTVSKSVDGAIV